MCIVEAWLTLKLVHVPITSTTMTLRKMVINELLTNKKFFIMNKKLLNLVVTLVTLFVGLVSASAETIKLEASSVKNDNPSITQDGITVSLDNFTFEARRAILNNDRYQLSGEWIDINNTAPKGVLSVVSDAKVKIIGVNIYGYLGVPGKSEYTFNGKTNPLFESISGNNVTVTPAQDFAKQSISISMQGVKTAATFPTIYIERIEVNYEKYDWTFEGPDPTAGGDFYIYHPVTNSYLTHQNKKGNNLSTTTNISDAFLWNIGTTTTSGTYTMKSGNYYFNLAKSGNSANPNLNTGSETIELKKSETNTDLNAFKIWREAKPTRYLNYNHNNEFTGAQNMGVQNDWVFVRPEEKAAIEEYKNAWDAVVALLDDADEDAKEVLDALLDECVGANLTNYEDKVAKLKSIDKATLVINPQAEYGTFVAPFAVTLPEGVTAYAIASTTGTPEKNGVAEFSEVGSELAAGTPVVVYKEGGLDKKVYFGIPTVTTETVDANGLVGVLVDGMKAPVDSYVINYIDGKTAFYIVRSEIAVAKNRCYLTAQAAASAKLNFSFGNATAIAPEFSTNATVSAIYNAAGARISAAQKGMNIIKYSDGSVKKILVK